MKAWFRLLWCLITGHAARPTGRHGTILEQVRCSDCGGLFMRHLDTPSQLLPWCPDMERFATEHNWPEPKAEGA